MMRQKLQQQLAINQPSLKDYQVERYVNKYVDAVMQQIARQFLTVTSDDLDEGEFSYAAEEVYEHCGQAMVAGERIRIATMMQAEPNTSLVIKTYNGNSISKRVSKVTFNPKYKKAIFKDLMENNYLLNDTYLDKLDKQANYDIPIDMDALDSYIENTKQALVKATGQKYIEKLYRNYSAAKQIKQRALLQADGTCIVKEYWEEIDSGRVHGHGLSLQRVGKEVRHAALGCCAKIDFKASSYAILTSLALAINPSLKVAALTEYIQKRTLIRKRIAKKLGITEDWMKQIFTSLGFGATLKNNTFNSIRKMLGKEKYALLIANEEFMYIKQALDVVRDTVLKINVFKGDTFIIGDYTYAALDTKTQKKRSKNQKLAWIYQACERMALDIVIGKMPNGYLMLLPVHDCIYIKQELPAQVVLDLKYEIRNLFPLLDFEQELIIPIHSAADHNKFSDAIAEELAQHKSRITQEEVAARGFVSEYFPQNLLLPTKPDFTNESDEEYEVRRKRQFLLDIEMHQAEKNDSFYDYDSTNESDYHSDD